MVNYYLSLGGIAQLVRAPASHAGGHRFEPRCLHQKTAALVRGWPFFLLHRGSKDERHRATVRWTVATASDQAPAGARVEPRCLHHEKALLLRCVLKDSRRGNGVIRKGYTVFPCFKPHLQGFCSFHSLLQSVPFHRELLLSRPHGSELQSEHAFFRLYLSRC